MNLKKLERRAAALALAAVVGIQPVLAGSYKLTIPSGYTSPFVDVQKGDWYYNYVAAVNSKGYIDGYGNGYFGANDSLSAGAALVMVLKAAGSGNIAATDSHWASGYADYAVSKGYLTRAEIGDLDGAMPRILVAQLAAKALGLSPSQAKSPFSDVNDGYLTALYEMGVITGSTENGKTVFLPDKPISRAEISVIIWQIDRVHTYGKQILFQNTYYDILDGVPVNSYSSSYFSKDSNGYMTYNEPGVETALGIDVSVYQGEIDWQKVADAGIDFAIIRVGYRGYGSEGKMMPDKYFTQNIEGALAAGLDVGVYYFSQAITVEEAQEEAAYVIEQVKDYNLTYPVVFDWERQNYAGSRTQKVPSVSTMCKMANAFCADITAAAYKAMVYFNPSEGYSQYDLSKLMDYSFWLAQYNSRPTFYYDFDMWQYTSSGRVSGISGNVDMNIRFFR